jgi:pyruvate kinase
MTQSGIHEALAEPKDLLKAVTTLHTQIVQEAQQNSDRWLALISHRRQEFKDNVRNLAHYMALRHHDIWDLQEALRPWGLSSLGRIEAQVLPTLDAVMATLARLAPDAGAAVPPHPHLEDFRHGAKVLTHKTQAIFGLPPVGRRVRMMVTMPTEAATDARLVYDMIKSGMNVVRINCAYDDANIWGQMIENIKAASAKLGLPCKISMDLGGPKIRTRDLTLPAKKHRIYLGDYLLLTNESDVDRTTYPVQIRCTHTEVLNAVAVGQPVWVDDGKIGTRIVAQAESGWVLEVTHAREKGERLREEKGLNFPETVLQCQALTDKDRDDLAFVVRHADIINYSFVQTPDDVRALQDAIALHQPPKLPALVLKVETLTAVRNLPELIVVAGAKQPVGVMIARGDLAVEIGYERLAEMQEEMLWICKAAHTPVIWATQVLENLAKKGRPSRAEVTDAAMAERAECVMLNKGPYILDAIRILDTILIRMGEYQNKKMAHLRALHSW